MDASSLFSNIDQMIDRNKHTLAKVQLIQKQMMGVMKDKNVLLDESLMYKREIARLKEELAALQKENHTNKAFIQRVQVSWDALNKEINEMAKLNDCFEENIDRLKQKVVTLECENESLKTSDHKINKFLSSKIIALKDKIHSLEGENCVLKTKVSKLETCENKSKLELSRWQGFLQEAIEENDRLWKSITSVVDTVTPPLSPRSGKMDYAQQSVPMAAQVPYPYVFTQNNGPIHQSYHIKFENNVTFNVGNNNINTTTASYPNNGMLRTSSENVQLLMEKMKNELSQVVNQKNQIEHEKIELVGALKKISDQLLFLKEEESMLWKHLSHKLHIK